MSPARRAALVTVATVGAIAAGFVVGLAVGRGTREALPGATSTEFVDGVVVVRADLKRAAALGLRALLS